jgi:hypothetical protein
MVFDSKSIVKMTTTWGYGNMTNKISDKAGMVRKLNGLPYWRLCENNIMSHQVYSPALHLFKN